MVWDSFNRIVILHYCQHSFRLPERSIEELAHQERDQKIAFSHRQSASALPAMPERERVDVFPDAFHRKLQSVRLDLGASTKVDAEGVEARLTIKLEYFR